MDDWEKLYQKWGYYSSILKFREKFDLENIFSLPNPGVPLVFLNMRTR